jgi:hypothetical protein
MAEPEWATNDPVAAKAAAEAKAKEEAEMQKLADAEAARVAQEKAQSDAVAAAEAREREKYESRMAALQTMLQSKWSAKETPPPAPTRPTATAEDFLDPEKALNASKRLAQEAAAEAAVYVQQQQATQTAELQELQFDSLHEKLKADPLYKYVEGDVRQAIASNPNLRRSPKALQILYDNLKGRRAGEIAEQERNAYIESERKKIDPSNSPISTHTAPPPRRTGDEDKGPQLTDVERAFLSKFHSKGGIMIPPERWVEIKAQRERDRSEVPNMEDRGR